MGAMDGKVDGRTYRDAAFPLVMPEALDDLKGPASGEIELPLRIVWSCEDRVYDVGDDERCRIAYREVIANGTLADMVEYVNPERLVEVWEGLFLPPRTQMAWEERFPQIPKWEWWNEPAE